MRKASWLSYGLSNATTRTIIHFYPSCGSVTAPYAANCKITIFGGGLDGQAITIEGARLSYPDGIRLEDVFPELREGVDGLFGVIFEISTIQPRVDLSGSQCVIELASRGLSVKFQASRYLEPAQSPLEDTTLVEDEKPEETTPREPIPVLGLHDDFSATSFIVANGSELPWKPEIVRTSGGEFVEIESAATEVEPGGVKEFSIDDSAYADSEPHSSSWGLIKKGTLFVDNPPSESVAVYACYRDVLTKRPVSVSAL